MTTRTRTTPAPAPVRISEAALSAQSTPVAGSMAASAVAGEAVAGVTVRRSAARGYADSGWLQSHHTFSFGSYHDPAHMGFGTLRVINEDRVEPGAGFLEHGHSDMEIISYVIDGTLGHRDSTGGGGSLRPGEVQVMSAGRGIRHSEMNASDTEPVHFLQIWVTPAQRSTAPGYGQKDFGRAPGVTLLVSPNGEDGSLRIGQDVRIHRVLLGAGALADVPLVSPRAWVQVVRGRVTLQHAEGVVSLNAGDAASVVRSRSLALRMDEDAELLVFDVV